jgi:excisionase family DNA binding protein
LAIQDKKDLPVNGIVIALYDEYLKLTGDNGAAASLTLADVMQSGMDAQVQAASEPAAVVNKMVALAVARAIDRPMTVPEVAKFLRVRPDKVLSWVRSGRLRGYNVAEKENGRPKYRINPEDLAAFAQQRTITQPAPKGRPTGRRGIPKMAWPTLD